MRWAGPRMIWYAPKDAFIHFFHIVKHWLQSLSFRTGVIVLLCCIPFYILSFAQMLLPTSVAAKGILWTILFGLAKTCQYGGLMETRKQIAAEKKRCNSHNCAQAILHTYADIAGISEDEAMNIAGAFGGGMGNMEGTCGALVGSGLVLGLVNKDKAKSMKQMRQIMTKFQEMQAAERYRNKGGTQRMS